MGSVPEEIYKTIQFVSRIYYVCVIFLAARHISVKRGAVLKSFIRAKILSLNPELNFVGKKYAFFLSHSIFPRVVKEL